MEVTSLGPAVKPDSMWLAGNQGNSLDSMDLKTAGCIELAELQCALKKQLGYQNLRLKRSQSYWRFEPGEGVDIYGKLMWAWSQVQVR